MPCAHDFHPVDDYDADGNVVGYESFCAHCGEREFELEGRTTIRLSRWERITISVRAFMLTVGEWMKGE